MAQSHASDILPDPLDKTFTVPFALKFAQFDHERASVNSVNNDEAARESEVAPGAEVPDGLATAHLVVITWVHIKVCNLFNSFASRVFRNRAHIEDTQAGLIVGLICEAIINELVVINRAHTGLVVTRIDGLLKVGDVEDISDWETVLCGGVRGRAVWVNFTFVKFIIED